MKEYLKENIDFNKMLLSTTITISTLLVGGLFGIIFQETLINKIKLIIIFIGILILILLTIISIYLYRVIKLYIEKLKSNV